MPAVNLPDSEWLLRQITQLMQQVRQIATQQNWAVRGGSGNIRVQGGLLPNGDYGLRYSTPAGTRSEELFPSVSHYHNGTLTTTSTTPVALATSPTVTATVGQSGDALVTASAFIGMTPTAAESNVYLVIDGNRQANQWLSVSSAASGPIAASAATVRRLSDTGVTLTPGAHAFSLEYSSSKATVTAQFSAIALVVQPL